MWVLNFATKGSLRGEVYVFGVRSVLGVRVPGGDTGAMDQVREMVETGVGWGKRLRTLKCENEPSIPKNLSNHEEPCSPLQPAGIAQSSTSK